MLENYEITCEKWEFLPTYKLITPEIPAHFEDKPFYIYSIFEDGVSDSYFTVIGNKVILPKNSAHTKYSTKCVNKVTYLGEFPVDIYVTRANLQSGNKCWLHMDTENRYELVIAAQPVATAWSVEEEFNKYPWAFSCIQSQSGAYLYDGVNLTSNIFTMPVSEMVDPVPAVYLEIPPVTNFFVSGSSKNMLESINIKDYLIDMGKLNYTFDNVDNESGANTLYYEDSDISFTCSGIKNNRYLKEFFGINQDIDDIKYMIKITKNNELIFRGVVNPNSIEETFSIETDSEQIQFQALGFLNEFKDYYLNESLSQQYTDIFLSDLLSNKLFNNDIVDIVLEDGLTDYMVRKDPGIYKNTTSMTHTYSIWKTGYSRICDKGENRWDFLNRICNAMGWVMFFYNDKLYIKNRSSNIISSNTLDFNKFIEYSAQKSDILSFFENMTIYDGIFIGGDNVGDPSGLSHRGTYCYIFTKHDEDFKVTIPFSEVGTGNNDYRLYWENQRYIRVYSEDNTNFSYLISQNTPWGSRVVTIKQSSLLKIDAGDTSGKGWVYWTEKVASPPPHNYPADNYDKLGNYDLFFTGHYGNILYKTINNKYQTYPDYALTKTFTNNFGKYINNYANNKIKVTYNNAEIDPLVSYQIINNDELDGNWAINSISYDFINDETELELQKKIV